MAQIEKKFNPFTGEPDIISVAESSDFDHNELQNLDWSEAGHTIDTDLDLNSNSLTEIATTQFDTTYTPTGSEPVGTTYWDEENNTISVVLKNGVIGQEFLEDYVEGQNDTGDTIDNGQVVSYQGSIGNSGNVRFQKALAAAGQSPLLVLGVATSNIEDGERGFATTQGKVRGIQTNGANYGETWNNGDLLYVSSTIAGGMTKVAPDAPIPAIPIAIVLSAHESNGTLGVRINNVFKMTELSDVNGTAHNTNGQILVYDNDNGYWDADYNINDYVRFDRLDDTTPGSPGCGLVGISAIGTPTYTNQCDFNKLFGSAGRASGGAVTADGTDFDISLGTGFIKATDSDTADLLSFDWEELAGQTINSGERKYAGVKYNAGSPIAEVRATDNYNLDTEFPLASIIRENGTLHILNNPWWVTDGMTNIVERFQAQGYVVRDNNAGGMIISDEGSRTISITAGVLWSRLNEFPIDAIDTSGTDTIEYYWYDGVAGTWNESDATAWSGTQWNDTTLATLQTLNNNYYCNTWIYAEADDQNYSMIYAQHQYSTLAAAQAEAPPTILPTHIQEHGILIGRIIARQGDTTPIDIESAFDITFSPSLAADHGNLAGLSDDDHAQYALLAGRSGGQQLFGSNTTGGTLTLTNNSVDNFTIILGTTLDLGFVNLSNQGAGHDGFLDYVANEHIEHSSVTLTAGSGLTGGGNILSSRTFNVGEGTGITVNADSIQTNDSEIDHDSLLNFVANEHIDWTNTSSNLVTSGNITGAIGLFTTDIYGGTNYSTKEVRLDLSSSAVHALSDFIFPQTGVVRFGELSDKRIYFQFLPNDGGGGGYDTVLESYNSTNYLFQTNNWAPIKFVQNYTQEALRLGRYEVVVNEGSVDLDFRVESNGDANNIFSNGGTNRVGIGTNSPNEKLEVNGTCRATAYKVGATAGIDQTINILDGNGTTTHNLTFTKGLLTSYSTS